MSIVGYIRESCNNLETLRKMVGRARRARRKDTPIACQGTSPNCGVRISSESSEHCEAMSLEGVRARPTDSIVCTIRGCVSDNASTRFVHVPNGG